MKKFAVLLVMAFLTLMVSSIAYAAPDNVDTLTITPSEIEVGAAAEVTVDVSWATGAAGTPAKFELYLPTDWLVVGDPTFNSALGKAFTVASCTSPTATIGGISVDCWEYTQPGGDSAPNFDFWTFNFTVASTATTGTSRPVRIEQIADWDVAPLSQTVYAKVVGKSNTGLTGVLVNSKTSAVWTYGAEILVTQIDGTNPGKAGSAYVDTTTGAWTVNFGSAAGADPLALCPTGGCVDGEISAAYKVEINYNCNLETADGIRPSHTTTTQPTECPITVTRATDQLVDLPDNYEMTVYDTGNGGIQDVGNIQTQTGPTAVSLQSVTADSNTTMAVGIGFVVMMLAGVTFVMVRRREVA